MAMTSLSAWATRAAASLPSTHAMRLLTRRWSLTGRTANRAEGPSPQGPTRAPPPRPRRLYPPALPASARRLYPPRPAGCTRLGPPAVPIYARQVAGSASVLAPRGGFGCTASKVTGGERGRSAHSGGGALAATGGWG